MKRWHLAWVVLILASPLIARAECTGPSPTWTATPDFESVSACVSRASAGGTVNVLAGEVTWTSTLTITKSLTLAGAGVDQTVISAAVTQVITDTPAYVRITGFGFKGGAAGPSGMVNIQNSPSAFRIDHNRFSAPTGGGTRAILVATKYVANQRQRDYGVIDHNAFMDLRS